ncbi:MAG: hypothetical protein KH696_08930 [Sutterella sp.]|uniref:hypothetical protein n=1 Tax=Dakarella massiliensis TaxID=1506471 RepID=UPI00033B42F3|nr:hypothetical protein [Sutterella sp.]CDE52387.1 unknown [Sutterella sp. CAG:351]
MPDQAAAENSEGTNQQNGEAKQKHSLSLGNAEDVYQICFAFIENVSEIFVRASTGEITSEQAEQRMENVNEWLTEALLGGIDGVEAKEGWTGAPLARSLIADLSGDISKLPRQAQEMLSSTDGVIMFAAIRFMHEVQEMVSEINHVPETDADKAIEKQGRLLHDLCVKWTDRFVGKGKPDIILPGIILPGSL